MVYHTVAKVGRKYFPFHGFVYDKGDGLAWLISAAVDFVTKFYQVTFIIDLKSKRVQGIALIATAIEIGFE